MTFRRGGFLVVRWGGGGLLLRRCMRRWRGVPVTFGPPKPLLKSLLRLHGVIPSPLLAVPRLLLLLLLPVRQITPGRWVGGGYCGAYCGWYGPGYCGGYSGTGGSCGCIAYDVQYVLGAVNMVFVPGAKTRDSTRNVSNAQNKQGGDKGQSKRHRASRV